MVEKGSIAKMGDRIDGTLLVSPGLSIISASLEKSVDYFASIGLAILTNLPEDNTARYDAEMLCRDISNVMHQIKSIHHEIKLINGALKTIELRRQS